MLVYIGIYVSRICIVIKEFCCSQRTLLKEKLVLTKCCLSIPAVIRLDMHLECISVISMQFVLFARPLCGVFLHVGSSYVA